MKRKVFVVIRSEDCHVMGTWSNLKYLLESDELEPLGFPSYSKITKRSDKESKQLDISAKDGKEYKIIISEI